jgi:hypothetical protein
VASSRSEYAWVSELGTGERDELALADRQLFASLANLGVEAVGSRSSQARKPSVDRRPTARVVGADSSEGDVGSDRIGEQKAVLGHRRIAPTAAR